MCKISPFEFGQGHKWPFLMTLLPSGFLQKSSLQNQKSTFTVKFSSCSTILDKTTWENGFIKSVHYLRQQNYFQINGFAQENPVPQFKVASYKFLGIRLSFEDPTTLLPRGGGGGGGGEGRIGRLRSLEKMPPKYAIFSTVLSKIVA